MFNQPIRNFFQTVLTAIYQQFHRPLFYCDRKKIYENAIFRLGFLPPVGGCLGIVPCDRLPTLTTDFGLVVITPHDSNFKEQIFDQNTTQTMLALFRYCLQILRGSIKFILGKE